MIDVKKIAELSRLSITSEEEELFQLQLSKIMAQFESVSKVNTDKVEPMVTPTDMVQHLRPDKTMNWQEAGEAFAAAPEKQGQLFKVPPVV